MRLKYRTLTSPNWYQKQFLSFHGILCYSYSKLNLIDLRNVVLRNNDLQACCQQLSEAIAASVVLTHESLRASAPKLRPRNQSSGSVDHGYGWGLRRSKILSTAHSMIMKQRSTKTDA